MYWRNEEKQDTKVIFQRVTQSIVKLNHSLREEKEKRSEEVVQSLMEYDFSLKVHPIDEEKHTKETEQIYKEEFYKIITNQIPLYYPQEVTEEGDVCDDAFYFKEKFDDTYTNSDETFVEEVLEKAAYHYMDITGDGMPELVFSLGDNTGRYLSGGIEVMEYIPEKGRVEASSIHAHGNFIGVGAVAEATDAVCRYQIITQKEGSSESVSLARINVTESYTLRGYIEAVGRFDLNVSMEEGEMLREHMLAAWEKSPPQTFEEMFGEIAIRVEEEKKEASRIEEERALRIYRDFLTGNKEARGISINQILGGEGKFDYLIWDVSDDGIPELHIKTDIKYYIYKYENDILFLWTYWNIDWLERGSAVEYWVLENGNIFRTEYLTSYDEERYDCVGLNSVGKIAYYWDDFSRRNKDEKSSYWIRGQKCNIEEWTKKAEEYFYTDETGEQQVRGAVEWIEEVMVNPSLLPEFEVEAPNSNLYYGSWEITDKVFIEKEPVRGLIYSEEEIQEEEKRILEKEAENLEFTKFSVTYNQELSRQIEYKRVSGDYLDFILFLG